MTTATIDRYMQFVEKVTTDAELERKLATIEPGNNGQILELAAASGFIFTPEELKEYSHEARILVHTNEDQLSEEDLELVAGGSIGGWILHKVRQAVDWLDDKVNGK